MTDYTTRSRRRFGLSKSKITSFEQCPKRLWLQVHRPEEAFVGEDTQRNFTTGHEVGALACSLCDNGIMVEVEPDFDAAIAQTARLVEAADRPIFEATFRREDVLVRVDILEPQRDRSWHVAEVKSTSSAKDYHIRDLATQIWVMEGSNVSINSSAIRHINRDFILEREGDYRGLFIDSHAEELIRPIVEHRGEVVAAAREILHGAEPGREIGDHCTAPFTCEFQGYCGKGHEQPQWPIALLPNTGRRVAEHWREIGISELTDIPPGSLKSPLHNRIHQATVTGIPFLDAEGARSATSKWSYPRTWLDFETIAFAIPRWIGTRPREQVPFQFSAHIEQPDGSIEHRDFLSLDGTDPRRACAVALLDAIPGEGAVIAYNASFERTCIRGLAAAFPDLAPRLLSIADRVVDLLPVVKSYWYHRDQRGSWSIKAVLPTLQEDLGYGGLDVADGQAAQAAYLEAIDPSMSAQRRAALDQALRVYCAQDTLAMVLVLRSITETPKEIEQLRP